MSIMSVTRLAGSSRSSMASYVCASCRSGIRTGRLRGLLARDVSPIPLAAGDARRRRALSTSTARGAKSKEIDDFYALLLEDPLPTRASSTRQRYPPPAPAQASSATPASTSSRSSSPSSSSSSPSSSSASKQRPVATSAVAGGGADEVTAGDVASRARVVFGSRLAGPEERSERARARRARSAVLAGVRIPPRPAEPDNCCMSGCVNCVWDVYREELEEWAAARREAEMALHRPDGQADAGLEAQQKVAGGAMREGARAMDDDGGGSETNWDAEDALLPGGDADLLQNVPVGIREFMRIEKKLGQKRKAREAEAEL